MKSRIRFGLLAAICALGAFASVASANDRDAFRQRIYERSREAQANNHRDHDRRDSRRDYSHNYSHNRGHRDYDRHDRHDYRRDYDRRDVRHFDRGHDHRHYDRGNYYRRHDRRHDYRRSFTYYDRFDSRYVPALKRGFYCDDFGHFRGRHYHVSRSDFYGSFYPKYAYRPFYDSRGSLSVIVSIPF